MYLVLSDIMFRFVFFCFGGVVSRGFQFWFLEDSNGQDEHSIEGMVSKLDLCRMHCPSEVVSPESQMLELTCNYLELKCIFSHVLHTIKRKSKASNPWSKITWP